jgi:large subunit ribosomal protein L30
MKVTQVKSKNGSNKTQLDTLRSLGLRRIGHTVELKDTPAARGMVHRVRHLVKVQDDG